MISLLMNPKNVFSMSGSSDFAAIRQADNNET